MKKKGFSAEQIIGKLRESEVLLRQGEESKTPPLSQSKSNNIIFIIFEP